MKAKLNDEGKLKLNEDQIQHSFINLLKVKNSGLYPFVFHIPNGGFRPYSFSSSGKLYCSEGVKMKRLGVKPGVADIFVMMPTVEYHGLWLEFKSENGKQTAEQKDFERLATSAGYCYRVVRSVYEAIDSLNKYFEADVL